MANEEIQRLLDYCLAFAKESLKSHGELPPFGAVMRRGGALVPVLPKADENTPISGPAAAEVLTTGLRRLASEQQATVLALCWDGFVSIEGAPTKTDAIVVGLEHENGEALDVFVPYRKRRFLGYTFGEMIAQERVRSFFSSD
jgi:hypothetical protein